MDKDKIYFYWSSSGDGEILKRLLDNMERASFIIYSPNLF
jgi:hypothetical protein